MISIKTEVAEKLTRFIQENIEAVPYELRPLTQQLLTQIDSFEIEEDLLIELLSLLQDYHESKASISKVDTRNSGSIDEDDKLNALIILLSELSIQEQQSQIIRIRR